MPLHSFTKLKFNRYKYDYVQMSAWIIMLRTTAESCLDRSISTRQFSEPSPVSSKLNWFEILFTYSIQKYVFAICRPPVSLGLEYPISEYARCVENQMKTIGALESRSVERLLSQHRNNDSHSLSRVHRGI